MKNVISIILFCISTLSYSQDKFSVESNLYPKYYVEDVFLGEGIKTANFKYIGKTGGIGMFSADTSLFLLNGGLILSTGHVDSIFTPNNTTSFTSAKVIPKNKKAARKAQKGDRDLSKYSKVFARDVAILEFDFVPTGNKISFSYIFASEEYPEYVNGNFNDAFAFFLKGPNVKRKINIAHLPDTTTAITVSNINKRDNSQYFRANGNFYARIFGKIRRLFSKNLSHKLIDHFQFDGYTVPLTAEYNVIPYQKYSIKLVIADAMDDIYDSAVFLEKNSFKSYIDPNLAYANLANNPVNTDSLLGLAYETIKIEEPVIEEEFEFTDIYFDNNSSVVKAAYKRDIKRLYNYLKENPKISCRLNGHASKKGSKKYNQKLSEIRANAVMKYLLELGIAKERLAYEGFSFNYTKESKPGELNEAKSRRVEIILDFEEEF